MALDWLPLTEYSSKYKVSISTLRRRIKAEDIKYAFEDGKYLILDEPLSTHQGVGKARRPSLNTNGVTEPHRPSQESASQSLVGAQLETSAINSINQDEPILTAANRLLTELKKAYSLILQEKEEQILHLKEEVADLKTLVRVLESENSRLQIRKQ